MKRFRKRIVLYSVLICLPAALTIAAGFFLIALYVPGAIKSEPARVGRAYREIAEELVASPEKADYVGDRRKGWQAGRKIGQVNWGYVVDGDKATVWYQQSPRQWRAKEVESIGRFPYALVFYFGGGVVAIVLVWVTALAVWHFRNMNYEREALIRDKEDFVAATVHDLTTPLVAMRHCIGIDDQEAVNLNERMICLVKNLKEFMNLGGSRPPPAREVFDVVEVCRRAYRIFSNDYEDSAFGEVEFGGKKSLMVVADEMMTEQVFWNLLGNNLKYAAPFGKVRVDFRMSGDKAVIDISDEGKGLSREEKESVFRRYYRAPSARMSGKGGFGIGLCTALEFARLMGGDLKVRDNIPRGCVFSFELPASL